MSQPANILIYRLGSLGDTVIALPCFHLIRKVFPHSKITLLTNQPVSGKAASAMSILENSGLCDETVVYPVGTRSRTELLKVREAVRQVRPQIVINLAAARGFLKSMRDYVFFRSCGASRIIGTPLRRRDLRVLQTGDGKFESESERLAARLASLGTIDLADQRFWDLGLTKDEKSQALKLLPVNQAGVLAVSVGTKGQMKDWGEENWDRLLALLSKEMPGVSLIMLGAPDEWEWSEKLGRNWTGGCVNLCGKTSPRVAAALMERCRLFIGHDSGPMHLASAVGTPTLGLFSWQNPPGQWFPGHHSWKFIKVLYPELPHGGWTSALNDKKGAYLGIRLLNPDVVFRSAMEMWHHRQYPNAADHGSLLTQSSI